LRLLLALFVHSRLPWLSVIMTTYGYGVDDRLVERRSGLGVVNGRRLAGDEVDLAIDRTPQSRGPQVKSN
jgi:hypothetical protein